VANAIPAPRVPELAFCGFGVAGGEGFALCCRVRSFSRSSAQQPSEDQPVRREPARTLPRPEGRNPETEAPRPRVDDRNREIPICGLAAVRALFETRADAIKRLFFDQATGRRVGGMSGAMARERRVYRQVTAEELEKIAGTVHHGGIVAIVDQPPLRAPERADLAAWAKAGKPVVLLDRIGNAHNLGAIVRTLAFFGVENLVVAAGETAARPGESTYRVAEGGMEHVRIWVCAGFAALCAELRSAGFAIVGTDVRGPNLAGLSRREFLPEAVRKRADTAAQTPIALVLGNEEAGLAPEVAKACDRLVRIPGSGKMESLNVSAAAAVLVAALTIGR
jgi:TrmH RNA methyltransferase